LISAHWLYAWHSRCTASVPHPSHPSASHRPSIVVSICTDADPNTPSTYPAGSTRACRSQSHAPAADDAANTRPSRWLAVATAAPPSPPSPLGSSWSPVDSVCVSQSTRWPPDVTSSRTRCIAPPRPGRGRNR
jgi:hypothetical protein